MSPSNLDETYTEQSVAYTDDLVRFWRSKVEVTAGRRGGEGIHVNATKSIFLFVCASRFLGNLSTCTVVQAVVKANGQSNGKGQILTP